MFVPVFLLQGTAKYLFSPLSLSVIISLLASFVLSFTLVPVLFKLPDARRTSSSTAAGRGAHDIQRRRTPQPVHWRSTTASSAASTRFRNAYRNYLAWAVHRPVPTAAFFLLLIVGSCLLFPQLGMDFFPQVDAGQMRLHVRAPAGHQAGRDAG